MKMTKKQDSLLRKAFANNPHFVGYQDVHKRSGALVSYFKKWQGQELTRKGAEFYSAYQKHGLSTKNWRLLQSDSALSAEKVIHVQVEGEWVSLENLGRQESMPCVELQKSTDEWVEEGRWDLRY